MPPLSPDMIEYLLQRKLSRYMMHYAYLFQQNSVDLRESDERYKRAILAYRDQLHEMPFKELQVLYEQELQAKIEQEERQRFFSMPNANADFKHWSKAAQWTLDEATALSFGKAPEVVKWASVKDLVNLSPFATQYAKVLDLAQRAKEQQQLHDPVLPGLFLAWAKRNEFDYPPELEVQIIARGHQIADWKSKYDELKEQFDKERLALQSTKEKPLGPKERQSALKLIIGMAMSGYGYDPLDKRSPKVREIANDLSLLGISLDTDTVRKWLKEAKELLPSESLDDQDR